MIVIPSARGSLGSAFKPSDISGLQLWLDATVGMVDGSNNPVTTNGATVTTWQDQSGNARNATQSTVSFQATLRTSVQNNKNALRFDGNDDFYSGIGASLGVMSNTSTRQSFFIACRPDLTGRNSAYAGGGIIRKMPAGNCPDYYFGVRSTGNFALNTSCSSNGSFGSTTTLTTNTPCVIGCISNASLVPGSLVHTLYKDTTAETTVFSDGSGGWGTGDGELGRGYSPGSSYHFFGDLYEIVIYNKLLSTTEINDIVSYLKSRWAIT